MAIIYSYPSVASIQNPDLFIISRVPQDPDEISNFSVTADALATFVTSRVNLNFQGGVGTGVVNLDTQSLNVIGTTNEIETTANAQTLQIGLPDNVTITNNLTVGGNNLLIEGLPNDPTLEFSAANYDDAYIQTGAYTAMKVNMQDGVYRMMGDLAGGGARSSIYPIRGNMGENVSLWYLNNIRFQTTNTGIDVFGDFEVSGAARIPLMLQTVDMQNNGIINLSNPVNPQDAVTKSYVDTAVTGLLEFKGTFRADTGEILSGANAGSYIYNCPGGAGARVAIDTGDYYIVANAGGQFYCSGDLLNIGDSVFAVADAAADSSTINDWGTVEGDNIEGSGTANKIPLWTDSQVLGDSIITQVGTSSLTISGNINGQAGIEGESLTIHTGPSTITGELDKDGSKITNLADPTAAQDAATKAYVDTTAGAVDLDFTGNSGTGNVQQGSSFDILGSGPITTSAAGNVLTINSSAAEGTGTTNTLPIWSDGPNGVLGDSGISQAIDGGGNISTITIATDQATNPLSVNFGSGGTTSFQRGAVEFIRLTDTFGGFYSTSFRYGGKLTVDRDAASQNPSLDVGDADHVYPAAWFRNGVVISNNPSGVQVDNTSMVIGAGNNDNVSGSDHCLIVGSGNQITSNSDQSVAFGQGNTITDSTDAAAAGNQNTITTSARSLALGFSNQITNSTSSFVAGGENTVPSGTTNMVLGYQNTVPSGSASDSFVLGNLITGSSQTMALGFRNDTAGYPTTNRNLGLGLTKFVVAVGSNTTTNANALIITEGGVNGGSSGTVPQVPRVVLPTVPSFSASNDAAADALGVPEGALYQNNGIVQINRGGGSAVDPLSSYVLKSGDTMTGDLDITKTSARLQLDSSNAASVINLRGGTTDQDHSITFGDDSSASSTPAKINFKTGVPGNELELAYGAPVSPFKNSVKIRATNTYFTDPLRIGADATANELDDYEEGTFTPTISSYVGGSLTPVYNSQIGEYTKVGNIVTASFYLSLDYTTSFSGTGDLIFGNLPFAIKTNGVFGGQVSGTLSYFRKFDDAAMGNFVGARQAVTSTTVSLNKAVQVGSAPPDDRATPITTADMVNTGSFYGDFVISFTITYRT